MKPKSGQLSLVQVAIAQGERKAEPCGWRLRRGCMNDLEMANQKWRSNTPVMKDDSVRAKQHIILMSLLCSRKR